VVQREQGIPIRSYPPAQFAGHILGNVLGPALGRIEGDDADRIIVLARKEILYNGFQVCRFIVGFALGAA
jgi:hypothetical protein